MTRFVQKIFTIKSWDKHRHNSFAILAPAALDLIAVLYYIERVFSVCSDSAGKLSGALTWYNVIFWCGRRNYLSSFLAHGKIGNFIIIINEWTRNICQMCCCMWGSLKYAALVIVIICKLFRPPDIVFGGHRFYRDSIFFFRQLPSELAERNWNKSGHMLGSKCDLKMYGRNTGYPNTYKSGAKNHPFSTGRGSCLPITVGVKKTRVIALSCGITISF